MDVQKKLGAAHSFVFDEEDLDELDDPSMSSLVLGMKKAPVPERKKAPSPQAPTLEPGFSDPEINELLGEAASSNETASAPQGAKEPREPKPSEHPDCLLAPELMFPDFAVDADADSASSASKPARFTIVKSR